MNISLDDSLTGSTCNTQLGAGALPCDAWHHYYHYQASAQYLWLAETLRALGQEEEAAAAYAKAIFQDHFNKEAIAGKNSPFKNPVPPAYEKHPLSDAEFCASLGRKTSATTQLHDEAITVLEKGKITEALFLLNKAIAADAGHSNSCLARGKCYFGQGEFEKARSDFLQAIMLSHRDHDAYHFTASEAHRLRGEQYFEKDHLDLAVSSFTKSLDLFKGNKAARAARAKAYRLKDNIALAKEDENFN